MVRWGEVRCFYKFLILAEMAKLILIFKEGQNNKIFSEENIMQKVNIIIKGTKPLLFNKFGGNSEEETVRGKRVQLSPRDEALNRLYREKDGTIYIPFTWLAGCVRHVAGSFKPQLNKKMKSAKGLVGGSVIFPADKIRFCKKLKDSDTEIYSTSAVIPATKGRIMVHRPMLREWSAEFQVEIDTELLTTDEVHQMFKDAGQRAGIGDYRISKGGPFGTFEVTKFKEV